MLQAIFQEWWELMKCLFRMIARMIGQFSKILTKHTSEAIQKSSKTIGDLLRRFPRELKEGVEETIQVYAEIWKTLRTKEGCSLLIFFFWLISPTFVWTALMREDVKELIISHLTIFFLIGVLYISLYVATWRVIWRKGENQDLFEFK